MVRQSTGKSGATSRRTFLKAGGATGILGAVGLAGADNHPEPEEDQGNDGTDGDGPPRAFADIVLVNGQVITMDSDEPQDTTVAEAVAIRGNRIEAVGSKGDVMPWAGPETERVDLDGGTVIPGLIDTHVHIQSFATGRDRAAELAPALESTQIEVEDNSWDNVREETLSVIEQEAGDAEDGEWVNVTYPFQITTPEGFEVASWEAAFAPFGTLLELDGFTDPPVSKTELDDVAPNNPVFLAAGFAVCTLNSRALERVEDHYGDIGGRTHEESGVSGVYLTRAIPIDLMMPDDETREEMFRQEFDEYVQHGITTWSSSAYATGTPKALASLAERGELAMRFAYNNAMGHRSSFNGPSFYKRKGEPNAMTTQDDYVWMAGASLANIDHIPPLMKTSFEPPDIPEQSKALEFTWTDIPNKDLPEPWNSYHRDVIRAQLEAGYPLTGNHIEGDATLDEYLDIIDDAIDDPDVDVDGDEIREEQMVSFDHGPMVRPDQIERLADLNVIASIGPAFIEDRSDEGFSEEALETIHQEWMVPTQDLLDAGVHVCWQLDRDPADFEGGTFGFMELLVTREREGIVFNADNGVDRLTALAMATRWATDYVNRSDIGSIEEGNLADLVILDGDFLEVADDEIHTVEPQIVLVDGEVKSS